MACILVPKLKPETAFFLNQQDFIQRAQSEVCVKQNPCLILDLVLGKPINSDKEKKIKRENITIFTFLVRLDNKLTSMKRNSVFQKSLSRESVIFCQVSVIFLSRENTTSISAVTKQQVESNLFFIDASCLGKRDIRIFFFFYLQAHCVPLSWGRIVQSELRATACSNHSSVTTQLCELMASAIRTWSLNFLTYKMRLMFYQFLRLCEIKCTQTQTVYITVPCTQKAFNEICILLFLSILLLSSSSILERHFRKSLIPRSFFHNTELK